MTISMMRTVWLGLFAACFLLLASCSWTKGPSGPPTPKTTKVGGEILINGDPAPKGEVELKLYEKGSGQNAGAVVASCLVGDDGRYEFNSYRQGDGAVPGEYVLSVEWLRPAPGVLYGPDKLLNNFNSPFNEDPRFQLEVVDGEALEIPTIDIQVSELKPQKSHPFASRPGKQGK